MNDIFNSRKNGQVVLGVPPVIHSPVIHVIHGRVTQRNKESTVKAVNGLFCFYSPIHFIPGTEVQGLRRAC